MKLASYTVEGEGEDRPRVGIVMDGGIVGDLQAGYARYLDRKLNEGHGREQAQLLLPPDLARILQNGGSALRALQAAAAYLHELVAARENTATLDGTRLFTPLAQCRLRAPLRPGKLIAVGRNYPEHLAEQSLYTDGRVPSAWIKAATAISGPADDIVKPAATRELDYATELAVVIGRRCKNVPERSAYNVVAGYMVVNDVTARDMVRVENEEGNQMMGKNFDTFCPSGPWLVTRDELPDPMNLRIRTWVNGTVRQDSDTSEMTWSVAKLICYLSQMTLEAGDVIATGTPAGPANGRPASLSSWHLREGDVVESEIEGIGRLRNRVVADTAPPHRAWKW